MDLFEGPPTLDGVGEDAGDKGTPLDVVGEDADDEGTPLEVVGEDAGDEGIRQALLSNDLPLVCAKLASVLARTGL